MVTSSSGELAKATISNLDAPGSRPIEVMFNPTEYSMSKSNSWEAVKIVGSNVPRLEFTSGGSTDLSLELFFDTYEKGTDVRDHTGKIFDLTKIDPNTEDSATGVGRPPRCMFSWGRVFNFAAVITSISIQYVLFKSDGTPVRARMSLTLQECEDSESNAPQNPTSQGMMGHKVHVVKPGETIDWIAHQEYNDSKMWRYIADANNLDDPKNIKPGQVLAIRSREQLEV